MYLKSPRMNVNARQVFDLTVLNGSHREIRRLRREAGNPTHHGNKLWKSSLVLMDYLSEFPLPAGSRVLDVGCGWGSLIRFAAEQYGVACVGITVSRRQAEYAQRICRGLPVEVRLQDYREVDEPFDRIASVGMFEHVGPRNYRTFLRVVHRCLAEGGLLLLHTIGSNRSRTTTDPWIDRYIFPGGVLPSARQITTAAEGLFVLEDWHSFGPDYHRTLLEWHARFVASWPEIEDQYGDRFYRMWRYYLQSTAGSFRARRNQLWQLVLSRDGVVGGYRSPR